MKKEILLSCNCGCVAFKLLQSEIGTETECCECKKREILKLKD